MSAERAAGEEEDFDEGEEEESKSRVSGLDSATGEVSAPTVRHDKKGKACNTGPKGKSNSLLLSTMPLNDALTYIENR